MGVLEGEVPELLRRVLRLPLLAASLMAGAVAEELLLRSLAQGAAHFDAPHEPLALFLDLDLDLDLDLVLFQTTGCISGSICVIDWRR